MSSPHQDSLLPRFAQGEEGHETTTKFPCLVCVDRVSHTVDIHLSDTKIAVRDSLQNGHREVAAFMVYESGEVATWRRAQPPFTGLMLV